MVADSRQLQSWTRALLFGGALGLLTACATPPAGTKQASAPAAKPAPEPAESLAALPPEPVIDDDPDRLMGLDPVDLEGLLGRPELVRRETPAQIWQYRTGACVLDVVLYDEAAGGRVTYVEARDRAGAKVDTRPCLNQVLRAQLGTPTS
ncbi:MAG: hypothetical protein AAF495_23705 [Pseudomonadota bacterium]